MDEKLTILTDSIYDRESLIVLNIIPYFIKDNLDYFLRARNFYTYGIRFTRFYRKHEFFFNRYGLFVQVNKTNYHHYNFSIIVNRAKPMKYKTKNKYIKGYNKN